MIITRLSEIETLELAFYFSLGQGWRILNCVDVLNGILLIGWTTAFFYAVLQRIWKFSHQE